MSKKITIAVAGATGYAGRELLKLLARHHGADTVALGHGPGEPDEPISATFPDLAKLCDIDVRDTSFLYERTDLQAVFLALPHKAAMAAAKEFLKRGVRVIDFSADYRLKDPLVYQKWYGVKHEDPENLPKAVYGLCEHYRPQIRKAVLLANPGCYPTSVTLPLIPLLKAGIIRPEGIIIDSKSGASGGGRKPSQGMHFVEVNESLKAYGMFSHRHKPEIDQELGYAAGAPMDAVFTPHLLPIERGILSTIYADLGRHKGPIDVMTALKEAYANEFFVRIKGEGVSAEIKNVANTNFCDIGFAVSGSKLIVTSAIDNLVKGAAGQALQNFNIMFGFEETTGLV